MILKTVSDGEQSTIGIWNQAAFLPAHTYEFSIVLVQISQRMASLRLVFHFVDVFIFPQAVVSTLCRQTRNSIKGEA